MSFEYAERLSIPEILEIYDVAVRLSEEEEG